MPKLVFLARVAFLCNLCFLVTFSLRYIPPLENGVITSTIIILGNIVSIVVNVLIHLIYAVLLMMGKRLASLAPAWLMLINLLFLILQIILLVR